jgi:hypothetical protein
MSEAPTHPRVPPPDGRASIGRPPATIGPWNPGSVTASSNPVGEESRGRSRVARGPRFRHWWRAIRLGGLALFPAMLLSGCNGGHQSTAVTLATNRIETQIVLSTTHVVAGHHIDAALVVNNPGPPIDLTAVAHHCRPTFAIYLSNSRINNQPVIALICSPRPFVISHGTTRLRFTLLTTYSGCHQGPGPGGSGTPQCLPAGGYPPLPRGSYEAVETLLPMPMPKPVAVTLTG